MNTETQGSSFLCLNRENRWADFQWQGLELRQDGALQLKTVPRALTALPEDLSQVPIPTAPAGLAIAPDGTIYYTDPSHHTLFMINPCDGALAPVPCLYGEGTQLTQFRSPRGVLFHTRRQAILVADSDNHRIQIFNPQSWQLIGVWGQPELSGEPQPSTEPGRFNTPWTLAQDDAGNVYVVDAGNKRVQKFDRLGNVIPAFWQTAAHELAQSTTASNNSDSTQQSTPFQPIDIASGESDASTEVFILDRAGILYVFDSEGDLLRSLTLRLPNSTRLQQPMGLVVEKGAFYVGDNQQQQIFKFNWDGTWVGVAQGYEGPIAALALDHHGNLMVHSGTDLAPVSLALTGGYIQQGFLWGGPFTNPSNRYEQWHLLKAQAAPLLPEAHLQLFVYNSTTGTPPSINAPHPFANSFWQPIELDAVDAIIPGTPSEQLWVGVEFSSEGWNSPLLSQIRLDFDHDTYLQYLPALYQENPLSRKFLARFLSLFESLFADVETQTAHLPRLFDPATVPAVFLPWLASWLAIDWDENWSEEKQRQTIAQAFEMYAHQGTPHGLRHIMRSFAGVDALIEEPIVHAAWWALPMTSETGVDAAQDAINQNSVLGFTTVLAATDAQGAVVGTTADLDRAHLITQAEFGAPLFNDLAHRFTVQVYRGQVNSDEKLTQLRALLDREKPAHTDYQLCIIEPHARIGLQARIGIDTVVAGLPPPSRLGQSSALGAEVVLGGELPGRLGDRSQIGQTTRLGAGSGKA